MNRRLTLKFLLFSVLLVSSLLLLYIVWRENRGGILTVSFLNIGQGDAIFIDSPSGKQILIDGGPGKSILRELGQVMPFYDRSIDVVLATHADQDHVGGLPDVLEKYKVSMFIETGNPGPSSSYAELEAEVKQRETQANIKTNVKNRIEKVIARRGQIIDLGEGVTLNILYPDHNVVGLETNTSSIVAKLVYGESEFLLTGDSPKSIENYLISLESTSETNLNLESDVLKVGHHGSKTSTGEEFVKVVHPDYAVISVGKDNRYGHPTAEVLETLKNTGVKILRTDQDGRVIFKTDGNKIDLISN